jgi:ELWxxDGT repeat protein
MASLTWRQALKAVRTATVGRTSNRSARAAARLTLGVLEDRLAPAGNLVADINPHQHPDGSSPRYYVDVNGVVFFAATDPVHGTELWKSDGPSTGAALVKDIVPGTGGSFPRDLIVANGTLYFTTGGAELWKSDGTPAGTVRIQSVATTNLTSIGGTLYFNGNGNSLWKSDGTTAGSVQIKAVAASNLTGVNGTVFFTGQDQNGDELWQTDGTPEGTFLVRDIRSGSVGSSPSGLTNVNGTLYFAANDGVTGFELWKSDGTPGGTVLVKDIVPGSNSGSPLSSFPGNLTDVNGTLLFTAGGIFAGGQLWTSDGTPAGTLPLDANIVTSNVTRAVNGTVFVAGFDGVHPDGGLWKTDATNAGTVFLQATPDEPNGPLPSNLTNLNGTLYFTANDGASGMELWTNDGTPGGATRVKDITPGLAGSAPSDLAAGNGTLFFTATDGFHGREVWASDGTETGTVMVADIDMRGDPVGSFPSGFCAVNGTLFFAAYDGSTASSALWSSDGTPGGTALVKRVSPANMIDFNGTLYFAGYDGVTSGLWKSDGTPAGTVPVVGGINVAELTVLDGDLFFSVSDNGSQLWKSDGTAAGTSLVRNVISGTNGFYISNLTPAKGTLYFTAHDDTHGTELWKSDGTADGTGVVQDIRPGTENSSPANLTNVNGTLYFTADDGFHGVELWKSDGTVAGTVLVKDIYSGPGHSYPSNLTDLNGTLMFVAFDQTHGYRLWRSDGSEENTEIVGSFGTANHLRVVNGTLFLTAYGAQLWKSDGTDAGTELVQANFPGSNVFLSNLTDVNGTLYFSSNLGQTLWRSNGTAAGTVLDTGGVTGIGDGYHDLAAAGNTLFFGAVDDAHGRELWASVAPPSVTVDQAAGQAEPVTAGPVTFDVRFSLGVTGFDAADVDLSASTVAGALTKIVTQINPSTYTVRVNGMFGAGTVAASVRAAAAVDGSGTASAGSSSRDNVVTYNGTGTVGLTSTAYDATEGTPLVVTARRTGGTDGAVSVAYDLNDGTAVAGADYADLTGTFTWADGEAGDKSISIPISDDQKSEVSETFAVALSNPTGNAGAPLTGTLGAPVTIARSNPLGSATRFQDEDGDTVSVTLAQPKTVNGTVAYYLTDGTGPIQTIELAGTDPQTSSLNITVKKAKAPADGLVSVNSITGTGLKALNLGKAVLDGPGINLSGMVQAVKLAAVRNGADIIAAGSVPRKSTQIAIAGPVDDGTLVKLDAPLAGFKAAGVGVGQFDVPSIGTMTIKGDFRSDVHVTGTGADPSRPLLKTLTVSGALSGADIMVAGNVRSVTALSFTDSRLFAGYTGPDNGVGTGATFSDPGATIGSFRTTGAFSSFKDSFVIASTVQTVVLRTVDPVEDGTKYGFYAHAVKVLKITTPLQKFNYDPTKPTPQGKNDFEVQIV